MQAGSQASKQPGSYEPKEKEISVESNGGDWRDTHQYLGHVDELAAELKSWYFNDIVTKGDKIAEEVLNNRAMKFGFTAKFFLRNPVSLSAFIDMKNDVYGVEPRNLNSEFYTIGRPSAQSSPR